VADEAPAPDGVPFKATAKYRYRQPDQQVTCVIRGDEMFVEAQELQRAVTPGQSLVLYQGDVCLGGGIEEETSMHAFA
jgi:tRNA-specific 2-thiouridylase